MTCLHQHSNTEKQYEKHVRGCPAGEAINISHKLMVKFCACLFRTPHPHPIPFLYYIYQIRRYNHTNIVLNTHLGCGASLRRLLVTLHMGENSQSQFLWPRRHAQCWWQWTLRVLISMCVCVCMCVYLCADDPAWKTAVFPDQNGFLTMCASVHREKWERQVSGKFSMKGVDCHIVCCRVRLWFPSVA